MLYERSYNVKPQRQEENSLDCGRSSTVPHHAEVENRTREKDKKLETYPVTRVTSASLTRSSDFYHHPAFETVISRHRVGHLNARELSFFESTGVLKKERMLGKTCGVKHRRD